MHAIVLDTPGPLESGVVHGGRDRRSPPGPGPDRGEGGGMRRVPLEPPHDRGRLGAVRRSRLHAHHPRARGRGPGRRGREPGRLAPSRRSGRGATVVVHLRPLPVLPELGATSCAPPSRSRGRPCTAATPSTCWPPPPTPIRCPTRSTTSRRPRCSARASPATTPCRRRHPIPVPRWRSSVLAASATWSSSSPSWPEPTSTRWRVRPEHLQLAEELGAHPVDATGGIPHWSSLRWVASTRPSCSHRRTASLEQAIEAVKPGGTVVLGVHAQVGELPFGDEKRLVGSVIGSRQQMREVLALAAAGKVRARVRDLRPGRRRRGAQPAQARGGQGPGGAGPELNSAA